MTEQMPDPLPKLAPELAKALIELDTPTICNALEAVDVSRRARGFNIRPLVCAHPGLPSVLGFARTARIRAQHKPTKRPDADGYYTYVAEGGPVPSIMIIEDMETILHNPMIKASLQKKTAGP